MASSRSARKAARATGRRTDINRRVTSGLKTHVRKAREAIQAGDVADAQRSTRLAIAQLDKAGTRGYIHRNKASRTKARLMHQLNGMMTKATSAPVPAPSSAASDSNE